MALPFPTLGPADAWGYRGMFIGEFHSGRRSDPQSTIARVLELWPSVAANIDIMFLEAFDAGLAPDTSSKKAVLSELERATGVKAWEWELGRGWVAPAYRAMGALAKRTNTQLRGIDLYPHPLWTRYQHDKKYRMMTVQFRMQPALHEAWATVVREQLRSINKTRYAVLGGSAHGPELKKVIPGLTLFALDTQDELREYTHIGAPTWDPVFAP